MPSDEPVNQCCLDRGQNLPANLNLFTEVRIFRCSPGRTKRQVNQPFPEIDCGYHRRVVEPDSRGHRDPRTSSDSSISFRAASYHAATPLITTRPMPIKDARHSAMF